MALRLLRRFLDTDGGRIAGSREVDD